MSLSRCLLHLFSYSLSQNGSFLSNAMLWLTSHRHFLYKGRSLIETYLKHSFHLGSHKASYSALYENMSLLTRVLLCHDNDALVLHPSAVFFFLKWEENNAIVSWSTYFSLLQSSICLVYVFGTVHLLLGFMHIKGKQNNFGFKCCIAWQWFHRYVYISVAQYGLRWKWFLPSKIIMQKNMFGIIQYN